jgi:hypothetical protein
MRLAAVAACLVLIACTTPSREPPVQSGVDSPYLLIFAGDRDEADSDFLAVIDLQPKSPALGKAIATTPINMKASMPHQMEYTTPPGGELLFVNAHHHEKSLLVNVGDPRAPHLVKRSIHQPYSGTRTITHGHRKARVWSVFCAVKVRALTTLRP